LIVLLITHQQISVHVNLIVQLMNYILTMIMLIKDVYFVMLLYKIAQHVQMQQYVPNVELQDLLLYLLINLYAYLFVKEVNF